MPHEDVALGERLQTLDGQRSSEVHAAVEADTPVVQLEGPIRQQRAQPHHRRLIGIDLEPEDIVGQRPHAVLNTLVGVGHRCAIQLPLLELGTCVNQLTEPSPDPLLTFNHHPSLQALTTGVRLQLPSRV